MKRLILLCVVLLMFSACQNDKREIVVDKSKIAVTDYRIYQNTPAWPLAKAVQDQDEDAIKKEKADGLNLDYQDFKTSGTLLMKAIVNHQFESVKVLLQNGADPNLIDKKGLNAVILACRENDLRYLQLVLYYKGSPNVAQAFQISNHKNKGESALGNAILYSGPTSLQKVKMLVQAGAFVNSPIPGQESVPIYAAVKANQMDIVLYLLEQGAIYERPIHRNSDGTLVNLNDALKQSNFPAGSPNDLTKQKIIAFISQK